MKRYVSLKEKGFFEDKEPKKLTLREALLKEAVASHKDSIVNFSDQLSKFLNKHKDNPNASINDIAIGMFLSFSEWFAADGDPNTDGLTMLDKVVTKIKSLAKQYEGLVPDEGQEFDISNAADEISDEDESDEESEEDEEEEEEELKENRIKRKVVRKERMLESNQMASLDGDFDPFSMEGAPLDLSSLSRVE